MPSKIRFPLIFGACPDTGLTDFCKFVAAMRIDAELRILGAVALGIAAAASCARTGWSDAESALIDSDGATMRVLTVDDRQDSLMLRTVCRELGADELASREYSTLAEKMVATVTSPEQDGVGIAGPQVGILRRVVAVMRYDKPGEPFEVYPNVRIVAVRGEKTPGPEGCLSIPGVRGEVPRYQDIDVRYTSVATMKDTVETVRGYTAVIFQHECDHLDGILFTDYL